MVSSSLLMSTGMLLLVSLVSPSCGFLVRRDPEWSSERNEKSICDHKDWNFGRFSEENKEVPLNLTEYIVSGRTEEGRKAAEVPPFLGEVKSYSGFLAVSEVYSKNLFFWYFPAEDFNTDDSAPVILWLQGGPGASSMYGALVENGPYVLKDDLSLEIRPYRWTRKNHMVYFDQPVGTGFSYGDSAGYVKNEEEVDADMYNALVQFFQLFPELSKKDFFIAGESYAGKYVPAVSYTIHRNNPAAKFKINLQGLAIGDGCTDAQYMLYSDWLVQHGFKDLSELQSLKLEENIYIEAIKQKNFKKAGRYNPVNELPRESPDWSQYNYLGQYEPAEVALKPLSDFFLNRTVKEKLHVGNCQFDALNDAVYNILINEGDLYSPISPHVEALLEHHYRVLYYTGQLDAIINYPMTKKFVYSLKWSGSQEFHSATRKEWWVGEELAGYTTTGGNLSLVLVRNAGHMVPHDQPKWADDLINKFIRGESLAE